MPPTTILSNGKSCLVGLVICIIMGSRPTRFSIDHSYLSLPTDYFRSNALSGDWSSPSSWESSADNMTWSAATLAPTETAASINVRVGHVIHITTNITIDKTTVSGTLRLFNNGVQNGGLILFDGSGDELTIANGGMLQCVIATAAAGSDYNTKIQYNISGNINILGGGKISIGDGTAAHIGKGYSNFGTEPTTKVRWNQNAIFEWNTQSAEVPATTASQIYFPALPANVVPVFRFACSPGAAIGSSGNNVFNGLLEIRAPVSIAGSGSKTFRDGFTGNSTLTLASSAGALTISSATGILDGNLTLVLHKQLNLSNGVTIPSIANVVVSGTAAGFTKNAGNFIVNGSLDIGDKTISNTSGNVTVNGILKISRANGLYNPGTIASGGIILNIGSTIEYNGNAQTITPTGVLGQSYYNLVFSGAGVKSFSNYVNVQTNGSVRISGSSVVVDAGQYNLGPLGTNSTAFTMTEGLLILGTSPGSALPLMNGTFNVSGGTIRYTYSGATPQTIRSKTYFNIEVTGSNVSNSNGNITLMPGGAFTVEPNGIFSIRDNTITGPSGLQTITVKGGGSFNAGNNEGFHGYIATLTNNSSVHRNIENIDLQAGSTVNYNRPGDQPITNLNALNYPHLILSGSGTKTAPAGNLVLLGDLTKAIGPVVNHNNGSVFFNGAVAQNISAADVLNFYSLHNNNLAGLHIVNDIGVADLLSFGSASKFNLLGGHVHLRSTAAKTASVGEVPTNAQINYSGTGTFIVERYLPAKKAWRFLSTPVQPAYSIWETWQESGNNAASGAGFGTQITGPVANPTVNGLDVYTQRPSMKHYIFDSLDVGYMGITNTRTTALTNDKGYMIFVRGDRTATVASGISNATTLRGRGRLITGTLNYGIRANHDTSVGNPYASRLDLRKVFDNGGFNNVTPTVITWDPVVGGGSYGVGAFRQYTRNASGNFVSTPGGEINNYIESGQAFFIQSSTGGTFTIKENMKGLGSANPMRTTLIPESKLRTNLYGAGWNGPNTLIDGTLVNTSPRYRDEIDNMDVRKYFNTGENISIVTRNKNLIVERRTPFRETDTVFYKMMGLQQGLYTLEFVPANMNQGHLTGYLEDSYLGNRTEVSLRSSTTINFTVNNTPASYGIRRFRMVFRYFVPTPVTNFISSVR